MSASLLVLLGCLLGVVQLCLGVGVGLWIGRSGRTRTTDVNADAEQARQLAQRLSLVTGSLSYNVSAHRNRIDQLHGQLAAVPTDETSPLTDLVVGVVREMVRSTQQLQQQLSTADAELQRQSEEIEAQISRAMTDELTGLWNRRAFDEQLELHLTNWRDHRIPFSLVLIDLDRFKQINDTFGHVAGDQILAAAAAALRAALRRPDIVARFGGEEFAAILPFTPLATATNAVHKALQSVAGTVVPYENDVLHVTASGGLASIVPGEDGESLIRRADAALYAAKDAGRDRGYLHDGQNVAAIDQGDEVDHPTRVQQPAAVDLPPLAADRAAETPTLAMEQACQNLSTRLSEVLDESEQR